MAFVEEVCAGGAESISVFEPIASTAHVWSSVAVLPYASVARTVKVWLPSSRSL